jgi:hypothetical protein
MYGQTATRAKPAPQPVPESPVAKIERLKGGVLQYMSQGKVVRGIQLIGAMQRYDKTCSRQEILDAVLALRQDGWLFTSGMTFTVEAFEDDAFISAAPKLFRRQI